MKNGLIVSSVDGTKYHYLNDRVHREDGPAIEYLDGVQKMWYLNGQRHRVDGPAYISKYGTKYWYFNGEKVNCNNQKEFERFIKLKAFW